MDKFVIEKYADGELLQDELVESNQRLLNEDDLDVITMGKDKKLLFVRENMRVTNGYYLAEDGRWIYGTYKDALNVIKRRV